MRGSKAARWVMLAGALGLLVPALSGCPKKDDSGKTDDKKTDKSSKSDKNKKSGDDDDKGKSKGDDDDDDKGSKEYAQGDVLSHVPKKCSGGRVYLNFEALTKDKAVRPLVAKLDEKMAQALKGPDGKKAESALKALEKAGIDPARDIRELAACLVTGEDDPVIAVGGDFAGKDVLAAIRKAADAADGTTLKEKDADGVKYLQGKDKVLIGLVSPNIIILTKDSDDFAKLAKTNDVSEAWDAGKGRILAFHFEDPKKKKVGNVDAEITDKGADLELKVSVEAAGADAKEIESDPDKAKTNLKKLIGMVADKLDQSPGSTLADDLRAAKITIDGKTVTIVMRLPNKDVATALQKVLDSSEQDLEKLAR